MTKEQVIASWGDTFSDCKHRDISPYGTTEQWRYGEQFLYFNGNEVLDYIQE
jgi:hypothetical protein